MEEQFLAEATAGRCFGAVLDDLADQDNDDAISVAHSSLPCSSPTAATPSLPPSRAGRPVHARRPSRGVARGAPAADAGVVLKCERRAEEWHFDEGAHAAQVDSLKEQCQGFKDREAVARAHIEAVGREAEEHVQRVLRAAEEEEQERARRLADLRAELVELRHQEEQLREDCQQGVEDMEREVAAERVRRGRVEEELRLEPRNQSTAKLRLEEILDAEAAQMREREAQIRRHREGAQREVLDAQRAAQEQVRDIERRAQQDLSVLKRELDQVLSQTEGAVHVAVKDRWEVQATGEGEVTKVDREIRQALNGTHRELLELRDSAIERAKEAQARDFALEALLYSHTDAALSSLGCAADEKRQANMLEHEHRQRAPLAVKAFGETFPRSTQYQLHFEKKSRSAALAASAHAVVSGSRDADTAASDSSPWQTRTRLPALDVGRGHDDTFAELAAA